VRGLSYQRIEKRVNQWRALSASSGVVERSAKAGKVGGEGLVDPAPFGWFRVKAQLSLPGCPGALHEEGIARRGILHKGFKGTGAELFRLAVILRMELNPSWRTR